MADKYTVTIWAKAGIDKYPAKSHAQRVSEKLDSDISLVVVRGERSVQYMHSDQDRPFRQDRYFYYLSGSNDADCWLTYHTRTDTLTLWLPPVDLRKAFYNGATTTVEQALERYDIDEAKYIKGNKAQCNLAQYVCEAAQIGRCAVAQIPRALLGPKIMNELSDQSFRLGLTDALNACRAVKDEHELRLMRKANEISAKAHIGILKALPELKSEAQVESVYISICLAEKAKQQSYPPICGSGENASQLHYSTNMEDFGDRQVLLVDAGAEWKRYASDVTRTMPINPHNPGHWQTREAARVYACVENIQESCIKMLGPGVKMYDVAWHSSNMALDALLELGILKGDREEILKAGTWMAFYPHGLGHHIGLEVHDLPAPLEKNGKRADPFFNPQACTALVASRFKDKHGSTPNKLAFKPCNADAPLSPGMVVTIEPGLYFNRYILEKAYLSDPNHKNFIDTDVLHKYYHVGGVRIEDDILVTEHGYENLTTTPKGDEALKIIRDAAAWLRKPCSKDGLNTIQ